MTIGMTENGFFSAPLVGMKFRPPAIKIVECLPASAVLRLEQEPSNAYDGDAIKVIVNGSEIAPALETEFLDKAFEGFGFTGAEIKSAEWFIGYIANSEKTGGKFATELNKHWERIEEVRLGFAIDGSPRVLVKLKETE